MATALDCSSQLGSFLLKACRDRRDNGGMSATKRATIDFDPHVHAALRVKAEETERTISDLVDEAVRLSLGDDVDDLARPPRA